MNERKNPARAGFFLLEYIFPMARRKTPSVIESLIRLPWWISIVVFVFVWVGMRFIIPLLSFENPVYKSMAKAAPGLSWFSLFFLGTAALSWINAWRKHSLLDEQSGLDSIRKLHWKTFEELLGEAYRRQGYTVEENHGTGPDGGVDLRLHKSGRLILVQAKQWKTFKIGVPVVREMYGLMVDQKAQEVRIVTSGRFTQDARAFAQGKPIELVEGDQLEQMIRQVQSNPQATPRPETPPRESPSTHAASPCPQCGQPMVLRKARQGANAGSQFWGCSAYPKCSATRPLG